MDNNIKLPYEIGSTVYIVENFNSCYDLDNGFVTFLFGGYCNTSSCLYFIDSTYRVFIFNFLYFNQFFSIFICVLQTFQT